MKKSIILTLVLALLLVFALAACGDTAPADEDAAEPAADSAAEPADESADETDAEAAEEPAAEEEAAATELVNDGLTLPVPDEYADLLVINVPENDPDGVLFTVCEKASVEAGKAQGHDSDWGDGWLFDIARISQDKMNEMRCYDMSGAEQFARDDEANCYVYMHPTDVRYVREDNDAMAADQEQWTMLNEWAATVPEAFMEANSGLTAESHGNSNLDICLARIAFMDDVNYTVSSTAYGPMEPGDVDVTPYLEKLMNGVSYDYVDGGEAPDGEYFVLNFPDEDQRFDFFVAEGEQNFIRRVCGDYEEFYQATFEDGSTNATQVLSDWYDALAEANGAAR
ncbi:MAG: hypothetical protein IJG63_08200 [Oscillospiraceae bacterium]|nr:hypothetical protein [Oscillospiraceae bacterium]